MPAEWEPHRATWIAWPHYEPDWPGKLPPIPWVYGEIARVLADFEQVEILCHSEPIYENAGAILESHAVRADHIRLHLVANDRTWLRDSAPTGVVDPSGAVTLLNWSFNAWAKYANWRLDAQVGRAIADIARLPRIEPTRSDNGAPVVLEGGGIETNGAGLLLVTEEWLLSSVQVRNPGLTRDGYEQTFREWLGARKTIWLGDGCAGDDTHGHIDDIARFVSADTIVLAVEPGELFADSAYEGWLSALSAHHVRWRSVKAGTQWIIDGVSFRVLHPPWPWPHQGEDLNEDSVVLELSFGTFRALMMGDAGFVAEGALTDSVRSVSVLKVGHHGSRTASGASFLAAIRPQVAIVSVGRNHYGHPAPETLDRLHAAGAQAWRTDLEGTVTVTTDGRMFSVKGA